MADVRVSARQTKLAQLETTSRFAHDLLKVGLISEATRSLVAFHPRFNRMLTKI